MRRLALFIAVSILSTQSFRFTAWPNVYNVEVTPEYIMSTALPSGTVPGPNGYKYTTGYFLTTTCDQVWGGFVHVKKKYERGLDLPAQEERHSLR